MIVITEDMNRVEQIRKQTEEYDRMLLLKTITQNQYSREMKALCDELDEIRHRYNQLNGLEPQTYQNAFDEMMGNPLESEIFDV